MSKSLGNTVQISGSRVHPALRGCLLYRDRFLPHSKKIGRIYERFLQTSSLCSFPARYVCRSKSVDTWENRSEEKKKINNFCLGFFVDMVRNVQIWALCKSISACGCLPGIDGPGEKWGELCQWHVCTQTYVCALTRVCTDTGVPRPECAEARLCTDTRVHTPPPSHGCAQSQICAYRQQGSQSSSPPPHTGEGWGAWTVVFRDRPPPICAALTIPYDFHTAPAADSYGREHFSPGRAYAYV